MMKVEIWSDVMCPFCYIGKRKFEKALQEFPQRERIDVEWKSYELMPHLEPGKVQDLQQMLVETKGMDMEQVKTMNARVANAGEQVGIEFNFEKALAVNTRMAHRLIHFAKAHGKQHEAEELLFHSFFTQGKNVGDLDTLL
jgi:predicted DsbA family dithiol-disulfide isomerase